VRLLVISGFSQATAQGLPVGRLVGCKSDNDNSFHIVQLRAVSNAALANKWELRISEVFVTSDAEVAAIPQAQREQDLTYADNISRPSKAASTDSLNM
jgi:cell shape-determining protein MreC